MAEYKVGDVIKGQVTGVEKYGVFLNVDNEYSGLIHISEISPGFVRNVNDYVSIDEEIYAKIIDIDEEEKRLKLSIKGLDYRNNMHQDTIIDDEKGFAPLKAHLESWILEKLKEIKKQSKE
ncbi:MAG: S1 RNA-binding domain-containing protein [Bacilli bacterium]